MKQEDRKIFNAIYKQLKEKFIEKSIDDILFSDINTFYKYKNQINVQIKEFSFGVSGDYLYQNSLMYYICKDGIETQTFNKDSFLEFLKAKGITLNW